MIFGDITSPLCMAMVEQRQTKSVGGLGLFSTPKSAIWALLSDDFTGK